MGGEREKREREKREREKGREKEKRRKKREKGKPSGGGAPRNQIKRTKTTKKPRTHNNNIFSSQKRCFQKLKKQKTKSKRERERKKREQKILFLKSQKRKESGKKKSSRRIRVSKKKFFPIPRSFNSLKILFPRTHPCVPCCNRNEREWEMELKPSKNIVLIPFLLLVFSFCLLIADDSSLVKEQEKERVSICYGVLYGEVVRDRIKFFVDYYLKLGAQKVVTYLHPSLADSLSLFQEINGFSVTMWPTRYEFNVTAHRENHKAALARCIKDEISNGATVIIICDLDEFFYFSPKLYSSFQAFLGKYRKRQISQITAHQLYYQMDLCLKKNKGPYLTIWDSPYQSQKLSYDFKSLFFTDKFRGLTARHTAHHVDVSGHTAFLLEREAHFKHYRRFPIWDGDCDEVSENTISYHEKRDQSDPAKKKVFSLSTYTYTRDKELSVWQDFVENKNSPKH